MSGVRYSGGWVPVSGDGGDFAGGGGGAGAEFAACGTGSVGPEDVAGCGDAVGAGVAADGGDMGMGTADILTDAAVRNAMVLHAAFGGSTNLLLHVPAIAHAAGLRRPTVKDWIDVNRAVPRLVDALPNGPGNFATVQVFLAGEVPEVMLHLRRAGLIDTSVKTVTGETLGANLDWWEQSERRRVLRRRLTELDGVGADEVILSPDRARARGLTATVCFPLGNLAPEGCVIKSTPIDPELIDADEEVLSAYRAGSGVCDGDCGDRCD